MLICVLHSRNENLMQKRKDKFEAAAWSSLLSGKKWGFLTSWAEEIYVNRAAEKPKPHCGLSTSTLFPFLVWELFLPFLPSSLAADPTGLKDSNQLLSTTLDQNTLSVIPHFGNQRAGYLPLVRHVSTLFAQVSHGEGSRGDGFRRFCRCVWERNISLVLRPIPNHKENRVLRRSKISKANHATRSRRTTVPYSSRPQKCTRR